MYGYQPFLVLTKFMWKASLLSNRWPDFIYLVMNIHNFNILNRACMTQCQKAIGY